MLYAVVGQGYQVNVHDEYVLLGNAALMRCLVASFVSDFVVVDGWESDDGAVHITPNNPYGILFLFFIFIDLDTLQSCFGLSSFSIAFHSISALLTDRNAVLADW